MIYFLREDVPDGLIKIGFTAKDPNGRKSYLQTGNGRPLVLITCVDGTQQEERALQARFRHICTQGEWFRPAPELLLFIEGVKWSARNEPPPPESPHLDLVGLSEEQLLTIAGFVIGHLKAERARELVAAVDPRLAPCDPRLIAEGHELRDWMYDQGVAQARREPFANGASLHRDFFPSSFALDDALEIHAAAAAEAALMADSAEGIDPMPGADLPPPNPLDDDDPPNEPATPGQVH